MFLCVKFSLVKSHIFILTHFQGCLYLLIQYLLSFTFCKVFHYIAFWSSIYSLILEMSMISFHCTFETKSKILNDSMRWRDFCHRNMSKNNKVTNCFMPVAVENNVKETRDRNITTIEKNQPQKETADSIVEFYKPFHPPTKKVYISYLEHPYSNRFLLSKTKCGERQRLCQAQWFQKTNDALWWKVRAPSSHSVLNLVCCVLLPFLF